jgi:hypothetical protein
MKNFIHSIVMLAAIFSVAVFATTTAVPKSDMAAVVSMERVSDLNRKKAPMTVHRLQSCTQERSHQHQSKHDLILETLTTVPVYQTGYG